MMKVVIVDGTGGGSATQRTVRSFHIVLASIVKHIISY